MSSRTYLFVPGNRPERFAKALSSGADAVVLDLEDAVVSEAKNDARDSIARFVATVSQQERARIVVRINEAGSPAFLDDLLMMRDCALSAVMLPKAESADQIRAVVSGVPGAQVLALVESARGIRQADTVAGSEGVSRLVFGTLDFALDLDIDISDSNEALIHAAGCLALASRLAGLDTPVAGVTPQIDDETRLLSDLAWSRRHGFSAKLCIHPKQIAAIHAALTPTAKDIEWARRVLEAEADSPGAARLDGRMIDRPVVLQARRTLLRAGA